MQADTDDKLSKPQKSRRWWLVPLIILVMCAVAWVGQRVIFQIRYGGMPIAAQAGGAAPDCNWGVGIAAWLDENADGIRDESEPPLPGVPFYVDEVLRGGSNVGSGSSVSDWKGETKVSVWLPGCPRARFEIYPEAPSGYRLTTPPRLSADVREYGQSLEFGFTYLPGVPTATPRPPAPACTAYKVAAANQYDLEDLAAAPDGTVWVATYGNGVARFFPDRDRWIVYGTRDGLADRRVRSITIADDGVVWFATEGGASRFDGSTWISYKKGDGLVHSSVYKVAIDIDGTVWFATREGVSHFDPGQDAWKSYTVENGLADNYITYVAVTPDGSIWLSALGEGILYSSGLDSLSETPVWTTHRNLGNVPYTHFDSITDVGIGSDGASWFSGEGSGLLRLDPAGETWTLYDSRSTNDAFANTARALEVAPDGSVWVASGVRDPVIYHLIPAQDRDDQDIWRLYDTRDGLPGISSFSTDLNPVEAVDIAPDGAVWVGTREHATRCRFPGQ